MRSTWQLLERVAVHGHRRFAAPRGGGEVRELGGDVVAVARMAFESDARGALRASLAVGGRGVEVVHAVGDGEVDQPVDLLLVDLVGAVACAAAAEGRPAHAPVAQQRYLLARLGVGAVGHPVGRNLALRRAVARCGVAARIASGQCGGRGAVPTPSRLRNSRRAMPFLSLVSMGFGG